MNQPSHEVTRREALKTFGAGAALVGMAAVTGRSHASVFPAPPGAAEWSLPALAFAYDALEPHIDARTMEIHHTKHHQGYINNARRLLEPHPELLARGPDGILRDLAAVPEEIRTGLRNNVGGHANHTLFWSVLAPGGSELTGGIANRVTADFGSIENFQTTFAKAALTRFGSGWAWLSVNAKGQLEIHSTANQDSPLSEGKQPLLGLDVWEHAYYLHYQNRRADYIAAFWKVVNWAKVDANYSAAVA